MYIWLFGGMRQTCGAVAVRLSVYRAPVSVYRALLSVYRALWSVHMRNASDV